MEGTVLIIMHPATGHVNASLTIASAFRSLNFRVIFAGHSIIGEMIDRSKFMFYELMSLPFGLGYERLYNNTSGSNSYLDILLLRLSDKLYVDRRVDLKGLVARVNPNYIFLDPFLSTDFILLHNYAQEHNSKIIMLQTMLPTRKRKSYPPLSSSTIPTFSIGSNIEIEMEWINKFLKFKCWRLWQLLKYMGRDDYSIVKNKLKKHKLSKVYSIEKYLHLNYSFKCVPEVVVAPEEFEFTESKLNENYFYTGLKVEVKRRLLDGAKEFEAVKKLLFNEKNPQWVQNYLL